MRTVLGREPPALDLACQGFCGRVASDSRGFLWDLKGDMPGVRVHVVEVPSRFPKCCCRSLCRSCEGIYMYMYIVWSIYIYVYTYMMHVSSPPMIHRCSVLQPCLPHTYIHVIQLTVCIYI